jgi:hypothetical protein
MRPLTFFVIFESTLRTCDPHLFLSIGSNNNKLIIIVITIINISLEQDIRIRNLEINPTIIFIRFAIISASKVPSLPSSRNEILTSDICGTKRYYVSWGVVVHITLHAITLEVRNRKRHLIITFGNE